MPAIPLYIFTLLLMALDCLAVGLRRNRWRIFTKPTPMIALIFWFSIAGQWQGPLVWFGLGLTASLIGDIFLLFPFRMFIAGLVSFAFAQVFYILGLNAWGGDLGIAAFLPAVAVFGIAVLDFRPITFRISRQPSLRKVLRPVLIYAALLSLMLLSAWLTLPRSGWANPAALQAAAGGSFFFISDSILAREKFLRPARYGALFVMVTYFLGQILLATGAILHFSGGAG